MELNFSYDLVTYLKAIHGHMQAPIGLSNSANSIQYVSSNQNSNELSNKIKCQVNQLILDNAECEVRLVSEMWIQLDALESALLGVNDEKKVKFNEDLEASFAQLWCVDVAVVMSALEFVKHILKDTHRYAQYLKGEVDRFVLACSRVLTVFYEICAQKSDSELQNQFLEPIDSIAQILSSLFKCPVLSTAISPESFQALFTSLMPYYLNFSKCHTNVESKLDHKLQSKLESIIFNLIGISDPTAFLLTLLRLLQTKLNIYNQDFSKLPELKILTEWLESFGSQLNQLQMSKMNLDLIFPEIEPLMQDFPKSQLESKREYRLLVALHEIVYKIVKFKGDPAIWEHLTIVKGVVKNDGTSDSKLLELVNVVLENHRYLAPKYLDLRGFEHPEFNETNKPYFKYAETYNPVLNELIEIKRSSKYYCYPIETKFDEKVKDTELSMLFYWIKTLASTSDLIQAKLSLDYLNQNFDDLALKSPEKLEPEMDLLVRVCIRQYRLFVVQYFAPTTQPSDQALQIFDATTSFLKRIFTSSISLKTLETQTLFDLLMTTFSFRLAWSTSFASESINDLEFALISSDLFDRSALICVCIRMLATDLRLLKTYSVTMFEQYWKWTRDVLYELAMPLQFASKEEMENLNLDTILEGLVNFFTVQSMDHQVLMTEFDKFLYSTDVTDRVGDKRPLTILLQLTIVIIANKPKSIWAHLNNLKNMDSITIQLYNQLIVQAMIQLEHPELSRAEIRQKLWNNSQFDKIFLGLDFVQLEDKLRLGASNLLTETLANHKNTLSQLERFEEKSVGSLVTIVNDWFNQLDDYVKYPELYSQFVDSITFGCAKIMYKIDIRYSYNNIFMTILDRRQLPELAGALGKLFLKLFQPKEYSSGHEHIYDSTFEALLKANMNLLLNYPYPMENVSHKIKWIWDLQSSLTNYSKPELLFPLAIEIFLSDLTSDMQRKGIDENTLELAQMRQVEHCIEMIQVSCEKLFFSVGSTYQPELMSSNAEKFQLENLLKNVDQLMLMYPVTRLEQERDYRLWELLKRVLERLYQHHGSYSDIERYLGKIANQDDSPLIAYFRQLSNVIH